MPDLGSDHFGVLFTITSNTQTAHLITQKFNIKNMEWYKFKNALQSSFQNFNYNPNSTYTNQELNKLGELFTSKIVESAN